MKKHTMYRGSWSDGPCYYVDAIYGGRYVLLAWPFQSLAQAEAIKPAAVDAAMNFGDAKAIWYSYGCCKYLTLN